MPLAFGLLVGPEGLVGSGCVSGFDFTGVVAAFLVLAALGCASPVRLTGLEACRDGGGETGAGCAEVLSPAVALGATYMLVGLRCLVLRPRF